MHVGGYGATGGNATVTITNLAAVTTQIDTSLESNAATINISGGTLTTGSLSSLSNGNGTILLSDPALASALTINDSTASDVNTYSGSISGTGSLTKTGASTQILSGNDAFTGSIAVSGGLLTLSKTSASSIQVNNGTVNFNVSDYTLFNTPVYVGNGGVLTGAAFFQDTLITLLPGGTFLPGAYNGSFAAVTGASALVQPASGSTFNYAALTLDAPTTFNVLASDSLSIYDTLTTNSNPITKTGGGSLFLKAFQTNALNISAGTLTVLSSTGPSSLQVGTLTISSNAKLDIGTSAMDISTTSLATVNALIKMGFNNGNWGGSGIVSGYAAGDSTHLTAVGVIRNNQGGTALFTASHQFEGITPGAGERGDKLSISVGRRLERLVQRQIQKA